VRVYHHLPMSYRLGVGVRAVALLLVAATGHAQANEAVWSRLRSIEAAFRQGDATALRLSFSTAGKVRVELKDVPGGQRWYAPSQLQVIFAQIFDQYATRELAFPKTDVTLSSAGTAFARGRWLRRARHGGPDSTDTLTFTLCEEGGDWRILEIRSSR
jgi:hypothetical protein